MTESLTIRIHGADGSVWPVHGQNAGEMGVWLGKGEVEGLFAAPIRQAWSSGSQEIGGHQDGEWIDVRDILLGFHVTDARWPVSVTDALFRQAFVSRVDRWDHSARSARIEAHSEMSGSRFLDVLQYEGRDFNPELDHLSQGYAGPTIPLRAGQPLYYSDDEVSTFTSTATSASGFVTISNPCPVPMFHKWVVTRCQATLPDFSWSGAPGARVPGVDKRSSRDDSERTILLPLLNETHGGATVDLDHLNANCLMIRDTSDQNMLGQMPVPGKYFIYEVPPHTPPTELPVSYTGAPTGGAMIQCIQPRRWDEPVGGEWMGSY